MNMWNSLGTAGGSIEIVPYSAEWPELFELEARRILVACTGIITAIEHIGSTAIPGMPAKPILRRHLIFCDYLRNNPAIATQCPPPVSLLR